MLDKVIQVIQVSEQIDRYFACAPIRVRCALYDLIGTSVVSER
jgi:hypothetical protein